MDKHKSATANQQPLSEQDRLYMRLINAQSGQETGASDINEITREKLEAIWSQRAVQLARLPGSDQSVNQIEVLLVRLGREILGIEVSYVVEIRQGEPLTRVPRVPAWVLGVTNLRGQIFSVIDLRLFLGLPAQSSGAERGDNSALNEPFLIEVESPAMDLVLQVDDVLGVETLPINDIHTESGLFHSLPPEYLRGVVKQKQTNRGGAEGETGPSEEFTVTILNLKAILTDPRILINDLIDA